MSIEKMKKLRSEGLTYQQIANKIGCVKSTVCYHLNPTQKNKYKKRQQKNRTKFHPYTLKIYRFTNCKYKHIDKNVKTKSNIQLINYKLQHFFRGESYTMNIKAEDIIEKFTENPKCYLTGEEIDIYNTKSYHFDHIIPKSRGGTNDIDNLGICTKAANLAKNNMTPKEFIELCQKVIDFSKKTV